MEKRGLLSFQIFFHCPERTELIRYIFVDNNIDASCSELDADDPSGAFNCQVFASRSSTSCPLAMYYFDLRIILSSWSFASMDMPASELMVDKSDRRG